MDKQPQTTLGQPTKKNPRQVFILAAVIFAVTLIIPFVLFWWPDYQKDQIIENGLPAEAKILDIEPTGTIVNSQYEYRMTLEVYPEEGQTYQADVKEIINAIYAPQFQPGMYLRVKYDPEDPGRIAIEETLGEKDE